MRFRILLLPALLAGCGTDTTGPTAALFDCFVAEPIALAPGEVRQMAGSGTQGLCLASGDADAEYVFIPFFARQPPAGESAVLGIELVAAGLGDVIGPPTPDAVPTGLRLPLAAAADGRLAARDMAFHGRLRSREIRELEPRIRPGAAAALPGPAPAADVPAVGELLDFNVAIDCEATDTRTGRVTYISESAIVVADTANPDGMSSADFRHFGETFDTLVQPIALAHFGEPTDIDANERAIIFFTRAVNEQSEPGAATYTLGFFWSGDLFPRTATNRLEACPSANQAEMFYMLVADPGGVAGPAFSVDFVRQYGVAILAHEYQHLINASRRLYVNEAATFERVWLNEGLSHSAEELIFYRIAGLGPGGNLGAEDLRATPTRLDAFNRYMAPGNFTNLLRYLSNPDTASLMGVDQLPTRGATWAFLRYASDRSGQGDEAFLRALVNSETAGLANLDAVLDGRALDWMQDWTVAVYADDAVPGVDARFTQPSWNYRNIYAGIQSVGGYPLRVQHLVGTGRAALDLRAGGASFVRFGAGPAGRGVVRVEVDGDVPPASVRVSLLRTR